MAAIAQPGQVIYPMVNGSYTLTDGYGAPRDGGRIHTGQDFAAPIGTPIYAAADGCVSISQSNYGGYGETVVIAHPALSGANAISTLYGHMNYGGRAVQAGQCVTAGQYIGQVGNTGWVSGSCLHFEVLVNGTHDRPARLAPGERPLSRHGCRSPEVPRRGSGGWVSLIPSSQGRRNSMERIPAIRTTDALGRLVLRHCPQDPHDAPLLGAAVRERRRLS